MDDRIVETPIPVSGVTSEADVVRCLQSLYDIFASAGLGQATFEVTDVGTTLFVKHKESVKPDLAVIDRALRAAGAYAVGEPPPRS